MWFQPESRLWLIKANLTDEARQVLHNLRQIPQDHEYLNWEANMVLN